jgi:S1-C subfamily serine protease
MENGTLRKLFMILCALLVVSLACSLFSSSKPTPTPPILQTQAPEIQAPVNLPPTTETTPSGGTGAVSNLQDVQKAVIQIESQGTFVDPKFGEYLGAGRGSGFIIDPSGLAVTNNHVVTGAGLLKVWVGGDTSKTYNAKVVGVSECSDLAVIQIEGEGFPYLAWFQGPINVGMDMYIAGFPLGEPEYTLTKGVISKAKANGMTAWSSIDAVVEYDATSNPGNSGGPVIDTNGQVIAVHYWGNSQTRQARGISRDVAIPTVEKLRSGNDIDTIGINGQAVSNEDGSVYGIWVSSVQPGSPADKAGIKSGDLLTSLGDLPMAADGTMGTYCDVLRSHKPGETVNVKLIRWAAGDVMEGQINGRELAVVSKFQGGAPTSTEVASTQAAQVPGTTVNQNAGQPGEVYYSTEFNSVDDWLYTVWRGKESGFNQKASGGKFRIEILNKDTWVYFINQTFTYGDVQLDTRVENLGQNTNFTGLFCRYSADEGWYEANVLNTGEYVIYYMSPKDDKYEQLATGGSTLINMGKNINDYTFICKGDELTLGINGVDVITISTKKASRILREGKVGVFVASSHVYPLMVEFDWFKASVPY